MKVPSPLAGCVLSGAVLCSSCLAPPPAARLDLASGRVRAANASEAARVSEALQRLQPRLLELLPDTAFDPLEVWVQQEPHLYSFPRSSVSDAEGLWAESHGRILLKRGADDMERTLAHELTHAALGRSWRMLPGSLEEGLCDLVSVELSSDGASRLRAGRLSSAALACGGLKLQINVRRRADADAEFVHGWLANVILTGEEPFEALPLDVFRVSAGLSSTKLDKSDKRGFYGLSFLVVDRIVARSGFEGLHALCDAARENGWSTIPRSWLLAEAELDESPDSWRKAASGALSDAELTELLAMYPDFAVDALVEYLLDLGCDIEPETWAQDIEAELRVTEGEAVVRLEQLEFIRGPVERRLRAAHYDVAASAR